jgi:hypothetical protein
MRVTERSSAFPHDVAERLSLHRSEVDVFCKDFSLVFSIKEHVKRQHDTEDMNGGRREQLADLGHMVRLDDGIRP